jgi:tRNA(Ile)-lysidine synthase
MKESLEGYFLRQAKQLWEPGTPLVVGVSGGVDSMALYALLRRIESQWPARLHPVHVNHQLRSSAGAEAQWLQEYIAERFRDSLMVVPVDVRPAVGESVEMAARSARYRALLTQAEALGPTSRVVVAHHRDDQAETVLMRILTGTGVRGLAAMRPVNGVVLRPLLQVSRADLRQYVLAQHIRWLEDASNTDTHMLRNRIRHEIMPVLETVNPNVATALAGLADRADAHHRALQALAEQWMHDNRVSIGANDLRLPLGWQQWPQEIVALVLRDFAQTHEIRLSAKHIEQALCGDAHWPQRYRVEHRPDGTLWVGPRAVEASERVLKPQPLPTSGQMTWADAAIESDCQRFDGRMRPGWTAVAQAGTSPLWVRCWRAGDRMHPLGLNGHSKKLQDIWIDAKIPAAVRRWWPVIVSDPVEGIILAVPGVCLAEEARTKIGRPTCWIRVIEGRGS